MFVQEKEKLCSKKFGTQRGVTYWTAKGFAYRVKGTAFHSTGTVHSTSTTVLGEPPPLGLLSCSRGGLVTDHEPSSGLSWRRGEEELRW